MADLANSTPVTEIHSLSGSTPPGAGRPLFRPATTPKPRPQIRPRTEHLFIERDVVDLGTRLSKLLRRLRVVSHRLETLERHGLLPDRQAYLIRMLGRMARRIDRWIKRLDATKASTARAAAAKADALIEMAVLGFRCCPEFDKLALSLAHDQLRLGLGQASLPQISGGSFGAYHAEILQLHEAIETAPDDRTSDLLMDRWGAIDRMALADRPKSFADAIAALAYARREHHQFHVEVHEDIGSEPDKGDRLILHLLDGAIAVLNRPVETDIDLLSLFDHHRAALADYDAAEKAHEVPYQAYRDALPPRPRALYWSACDRVRPAGRERVPGSEGSWYYVYDTDDIERMRDKPATTIVEHRRPAPWDPNDTIVRRERVPDEVGEARRLEIIAAWDAWETAQDAVIESTGLNAANAAMDAASEALNVIEDALLAKSPRTVEGLLAKARWIADKPRSEMYLTPLFRDLCAALPSVIPSSLADEGALRDVVAQFRDVDFQQLYLCSAYKCDTDQIPGYEATEAPWRSALVQIADYPAQTWAGIVAKAEILKTESVWQDRDRSESIGDSIAEDVLRLAGRTWDPRLNRDRQALPNASTATRAA